MSEVKCKKCPHVGDTDENGICQTLIGARNWEPCRCRCEFPESVGNEATPGRIWIDRPMLKQERARKVGRYYFDPGVESDDAIEYVSADASKALLTAAKELIEDDGSSLWLIEQLESAIREYERVVGDGQK